MTDLPTAQHADASDDVRTLAQITDTVVAAARAAGDEVTDRTVIVAIDGRSGAGKTSLAGLVAERLDEAELRSLAGRLAGDPVDALIRRDKRYKDLGLQADGLGVDEVVAILLEHPQLLQRPILDDGTTAVIGRPRERQAAWAAAGRAVVD